MRARHATLGVLALSAGLLLAGCSDSDDPTPSAAPASTATVTETVTETATPNPSASASTSTTKPAEDRACATADLTAKVTEGESGAGQRRAAVVVTNTSDESCTITGYPGLQLTTSSGAKVPTKVVRATSPAPRTITVAPKGSAAADISFGVVPSGSEPTDGPCEQEASKLRVIPPNATTSVTAAWDLGPVCNKGRISTNAFVAGNGN